MKTKPLYLTLFPIFAFLLALSFPLQIYYLYQTPLHDLAKIFSMLTPLNLLTMTTLILTSVLTLSLNKWVYKIVPLLLLTLFINNAVVGLYGTDYTLAQVCVSFVLFALSLKPFYKNEIKAVIQNPRLRWWQTPKRYNMIKPLRISSEHFNIYSQSVNVSETGIFAEIQEKELLESLKVNDIVKLDIIDKDKITLEAKVVRVNSNHEVQPDGFGLHFLQNDNHKKSFLPWFKQNTYEMAAA
ncbi:MAG: PilZ domain-containing protein [Bacteriovoracaceae bacterium]|jgi:hypothetical protein|nr:PilZ domain-containing protein [Bacteriovoracaceae bacterium]